MIDFDDVVNASHRFKAVTIPDGTGFQLGCLCGQMVTFPFAGTLDQDNRRVDVTCSDCGRVWRWELTVVFREVGK